MKQRFWQWKSWQSFLSGQMRRVAFAVSLAVVIISSPSLGYAQVTTGQVEWHRNRLNRRDRDWRKCRDN